MRFFSRVVFICNICFIISAAFRFIELWKRKGGNNDNIIPLQAVEGSIAVLGLLLAVILNAVFVFIILYRKSIRKTFAVGSRFIVAFNLILFPIEIWYHFFYRG